MDVFLANLIAAKTGAPDLDDGSVAVSERASLLAPKAAKAAKRTAATEKAKAARPSAAHTKRFEAWVAANAPRKADLDPREMETIRKRLVAVLRRENDALPAPHRYGRGAYGHWNLFLVRATGAVEWTSQGRRAFPAADEVRPLLERIALLTRQKEKEIKVVVSTTGVLFPDKRTTIHPPIKNAKSKA